MTQKQRTAILGASGYTGAELIGFLLSHPQIEIVALSADKQAGKAFTELYPHFSAYDLPVMQKIDAIDFAAVDVVFCCLPHATTQAVVKTLPESCVIIDLSADFRLRDADTYAQWYGHAHQALPQQAKAVYGLTEHNRAAVKKTNLIANPGCYPTSVLLPLLPLLKAGVIDVSAGIIADAKSGVSGAGRSLKENLLYCEVNESFSAYGVGHHRHMPEMMQEMELAASGVSKHFRFTPHLVPMNRGMLSTIYVTLNKDTSLERAREILEKYYMNEPFVQMLPVGVTPTTAHVRGTNQCFMNIFQDRIAHGMIIVSVIDNVVKGASGQALQNFNARFGYAETLGLHHRGGVV